jgi:hypothetical protein
MKRTAMFVIFGWMLAAAFTKTPVAQADVAPVPTIARHVCNEIALNPTPQQVENVVLELYAVGNTQQQEQDIMAYAMNVTCPEYKPLAIQAVLNIMQQGNHTTV